ncbi:YidC/Oxa1 family membrane protein insertase [Pseudarthrobacter equi]|uniref:Membrane protein insertase YidC n=1 Tax=Pseudarthrobacter equi TaxID=728066 RepID=A0A1H2AUZ3_9MICC|nr:membrane protein insertase YidC [Pseudarthrobacter equi]SDT49731.1 YidC/Oxa1 family membrane protein insertase [Pseudarthrobacter equi]
MDVLAQVMEPFRWLMSAVLVAFHDGLTALGLPADGGGTWTLAIIGLVLVVRATLVPVFLAQVRAQRRMRQLQPDLKALQEKYAGRTDQPSRQAMAQEQMALYKKHGTNPFSACLPLLIQAPFFLGLFQVLAGIPDAVGRGTGIGAMEAAQAEQFNVSTIFGAPLSASLLHGGGDAAAVAVLAVAMILVMTACQFLTQKLVSARTMTTGDADNPLVRQQRILLYALPIVFALGGAFFPIGVLVYWTVSNLWTLGQQYLVNRKA